MTHKRKRLPNRQFNKKRRLYSHKKRVWVKKSRDNAQYTEWRKSVKERDGYQCQFPGCTCTRYLEVHHILPWSEYPTLRYNTNNGITLCKNHHKLIKDREHQFVKMFHSIIINQRKNEDNS